jgi:NAD(P)-dependent dehydrogenase (short-subunit alcohol dehydrogenase family)
MDMGLDGKVAIVTGGSEGIGKAAALSLSAEGASVAILARRKDVLDKAAQEISSATGGKVLALPCDVTDPAQIKSAFNQAVQAFGRLDILVNNAGTSAAALFEDVDDDTWRYDIELKVFGAIRCTREALPHMKKQRSGRIINITTPGGKAPATRSVPTSVSRAAGIALTKELSKDYAEYGILVNTVCIGLIKSGQHERRYERALDSDPDLNLDAWYEQMGKRVPLGRVGESREAGDLICFLASERASYVTGASINIDGGMAPVV